MTWCNLFKCNSKDIDKLEMYIEIDDAGCKSNCKLCLFSEDGLYESDRLNEVEDEKLHNMYTDDIREVYND